MFSIWVIFTDISVLRWRQFSSALSWNEKWKIHNRAFPSQNAASPFDGSSASCLWRAYITVQMRATSVAVGQSEMKPTFAIVINFRSLFLFAFQKWYMTWLFPCSGFQSTAAWRRNDSYSIKISLGLKRALNQQQLTANIHNAITMEKN